MIGFWFSLPSQSTLTPYVCLFSRSLIFYIKVFLSLLHIFEIKYVIFVTM